MKTQPADYRASEKQQKVKRTSLFIFDHAGEKIYLTNYDADITVTGLPGTLGADPQVFTAAAVRCSTFEQSTELNAPKVDIALGINSSAAAAALKSYIITALPKTLTVRVFQVSSNALPGPLVASSALFQTFRGLKTQLTFLDFSINASFLNLMLQGDGQVPRFYYSKTCQHPLYSQVVGTCQLDPEAAAHSMTVLVTAVDRINRHVDIAETHINGVAITGEVNFEGGILKELDGDGNPVSLIPLISNDALGGGSGTRLYMSFWSASLAIGTSIRIYRGCRRLKKSCVAFNNLPNFGGQPYIPDANPAVDGITA